VTRAFRQFVDAVLPTSCIGCQALGSHICNSCRANFTFGAHRVSRQDFHGCTSTELNREAHLLISAVKDDGRTGLLRVIAESVVSSLHEAVTRADFAMLPFAQVVLQRPFAIVPIPSGKAARLRRGFDPVASLAKLVARDLNVQVQPGLILARETRDQRALSIDERAANLQGAMRFRSTTAFSGPVILFDDVVTTGATLLEARRAVEAGGINVAGFITFAETPSLRDANVAK